MTAAVLHCLTCGTDFSGVTAANKFLDHVPCHHRLDEDRDRWKARAERAEAENAHLLESIDGWIRSAIETHDLLTASQAENARLTAELAEVRQ